MLKLYNSLSRKKEVFQPLKGKRVRLFVCGPTVYDFSHIGHARTYIFFDMFAKYLRRCGYEVFYLQNITDIDDKIIQRARERNEDHKTLAREMEKEYLADMKSLGVDSVSSYARASDHIKEIISQTRRLLGKGYAYKTQDGIYYDIKKFADYGKLSGRTREQAEDAVSRIDESTQKKNKGDFALWKYAKEGEPMWDFKTGKYLGTARSASVEPMGGRPGWHIEDTAITEKYFGPQYDIHGGARDLEFPHHEAEIAQMEAISGKKPLVRYWLHTGFLTVKGEKMAKSLGNFITIRDFLKEHSPRVLRLFVLKSHYRSPLDYSEKAIQQAERELERIEEFVDKIQNSKIKNQNDNSKFKIVKFQREFYAAFEDDLNTPKAIAAVFDLVRQGNLLLAKNKMSPKDAKEILKFFKEIDGFLQFIFWGKPKKEKIPAEILQLVAKREKYRRQKNWAKADAIREAIKKLGYWIEDTETGPTIKKRRAWRNQ